MRNEYVTEKWYSKLLYFILPVLIALLILLVAQPVDVFAANPRINKKQLTIYKGASASLKVTGNSGKVRWSSSKKTVATVTASGKVNGKKAGKAVIYAKTGKKTLKCKVTVKNPDKSMRLKLAKKEAKRIVKKYVTADMNTAERGYVLFRYLTENCSWQLNQSAKAYAKNYGNEAYAALVLKKAACSGYAKAYTLLCNAANIPVKHVNSNSWTHQWNEIKVNGKWIKVDTYGSIFEDTTGIRASLLKSKHNKEQLVFRFTTDQIEW